jgi:hypothetical protein
MLILFASFMQAYYVFLETGCFYPNPQIRYRPRYPGVNVDDRIDRSETKSTRTVDPNMGCSKFYSDSLEDGLTGGLLVLWCRHGISLGFHNIPQGEGRNDVFSAIYTRWPKAPKIVIYDFACALAPYCMLREAEFFKETRFYNDCFHASGHTKCSAATDLTFAREHDPLLLTIESSSVAESRNRMIRRITKSLSYMSERRAILLVYLFLSTINRVKHLEILHREAAAGCSNGVTAN